MNRVIKFRAWCNDKKQFVNPTYNNTKLDDLFKLPFYELQQFTGVQDKEFNDVYVGDFVETVNGRLFEVRFGEYTYYNETTAYGFYLYSEHGSIPLNKSIEVIGNVFEGWE